jgi:hypothetical protein
MTIVPATAARKGKRNPDARSERSESKLSSAAKYGAATKKGHEVG